METNPIAAGPAAPVIAYAIERRLYVNLTNRCTLRCIFCPKWQGDWRVRGHTLRLRREPPVAEVWRAVEAAGPERFDEVVFCGLGEPTRRLSTLLAVAALLKARGVRVRVDTDGLANLRAGRDVTPRLARVADSLSVSLNAPDPATYAAVCPSRYGAAAHGAVCAFIRSARASGLRVVASVVALPGLDLAACERLARTLDVPLRVRPFNRLGEQVPAGVA